MVYKKIKGHEIKREERNKKIRKLYDSGDFSMAEIGVIFGISKQAVSLIIKAH